MRPRIRVCRTRVERHLHLRGALSGKIRTAEFQGIVHTVVPVVALMEGVIWPMNAPAPEFVPAEELASAPWGWNGRPCVNDHPIRRGEAVSANDPEILEDEMFGQVFNARMKDTALQVEGWLNPVLAEKIGPRASEIIQRAIEQDDIEVSVGVFVDLEDVEDEWEGQKFKGIWRNIVPDHLAFLSKGSVGACSVEMGCGAPRTARLHVLNSNATRITIQEVKPMPEVIPAAGPPEQKPKSWLGRLKDLLKSEGKKQVFTVGANAFDMSDSDVQLRRDLETELRAVTPGFMWVEGVDPSSRLVLFATMPRDEFKYFTQEYSDRGGNIKLKGEATEVELVTRFEPVNDNSPTAAAGNGCGCHERNAMTKTERVKNLIASKKNGFTADHQAVLESMTDDQLKTLETVDAAIQVAETPEAPKAPEPPKAPDTPSSPSSPSAPSTPSSPSTPSGPVTKEEKVATSVQMSEEDVLKQFPSIRQIVDRQRTLEANQKKELVAKLKDAQSHYNEDALKAMPLDQLEGLAKVAKLDTTSVDMSFAAPRAAEKQDEIPPAPSLIAAIQNDKKKSA